MLDNISIVNFINELIAYAANAKASDIHLEPFEQTYRIRLRQDGLLQEYAQINTRFASKITLRVKIIAQLDISEQRLPQDGHLKMMLPNNQVIDCRISTCPTLFGEKIVIRLLDQNKTPLDTSLLGYEPCQQKILLHYLYQPQGMILVTGPTGSGKTISLYSALNTINDVRYNICSVEDPVEINLENINQVNINPKANFTFATALRAFLRQDPDLIMVGEIRDLETAEIAIKAAQTGHMILSTLHTNSAAQAITRLINLGIANFNLAAALRLIIAQRLCRKLCNNCKITDNTAHKLLKLQANHNVYKAAAKGCNQCYQGYKGRIGIYELLIIDDQIEKFIISNQSSTIIQQYAVNQGMLTLKQTGINKVIDGITSLDEINRVLI